MFKLISKLINDSSETETQLLAQLCKESPELPDWSAAVQPMLSRLLDRSSIPRAMVSCVLDMPFNALALPHKTIVLAQSLVEFCRNERDQMAFVVAHEAAHIHLGHAAERSRIEAVTSFVPANPLAKIALQFCVGRTFNRQQEFEADRVAVSFCARAGYAPQAAVAFLERLAALDRSTVGALLDAHPPLAQRLANLRGQP